MGYFLTFLCVTIIALIAYDIIDTTADIAYANGAYEELHDKARDLSFLLSISHNMMVRIINGENTLEEALKIRNETLNNNKKQDGDDVVIWNKEIEPDEMWNHLRQKQARSCFRMPFLGPKNVGFKGTVVYQCWGK